MKVRKILKRLQMPTFLCIAALVAMVAIMLPAGTGVTKAAQPLTCGSWGIVTSPNAHSAQNYLLAVATVSTNDVWAVGWSSDSRRNSPLQPLIEHWNGTSWSMLAIHSPYL